MDPETHTHQNEILHHNLSLCRKTNINSVHDKNITFWQFSSISIVEPLWNKIIIWHICWVKQIPFFDATRFRDHRYVEAPLTRPDSTHSCYSALHSFLSFTVHTEGQRPLSGVHSWWKNWPRLVRVGVHAQPPFTTFTITYKVAVYATAEWADILALFHLY
jgi:hypothetical protein